MSSFNPNSRRATGVTYRCQGRGALLSLPNGGRREDVIRTKALEDDIRDHVEGWFRWARIKGLPVERMDDLIIVSGCTLVTSWAAAAFVDHTTNAEIFLESRTLSNGGTKFVWSNIQGPVVHHNSLFNPVRTPAYVQSTCTYFIFILLVFMESRIHSRLRISASSSGASEQGAFFSGSKVFELQQNPVLMSLTIAETMRYK